MKLSKIFLTFLILAAAAQFCAGQEKPKAILIDHFGKMDCDEFLGRLDNLFVETDRQAGANGYAVIYAGKDSLAEPLKYEFWTKHYVAFRKFPEERLHVIRIRREGPTQMEFWLVPQGIDQPPIQGESWTNVLPPDFKPFLFGIGEGGDCPSVNVESYADFLLANPSAYGNLAVYSRSPKAAKKEVNSILKILVNNFKVPRDRVRLFYKSEDRIGNYGPLSPMIEFWLVPPRKTRAAKVRQ